MLGRSYGKVGGLVSRPPVAMRATLQTPSLFGNHRRSFGLRGSWPRRLPPPSFSSQTLSDLPLCNILNPDGYVSPAIEEGAKAAVFAIFDDGKKLQYIGFSKELDASLKTVFTRRPDKAYYYKACHLKELNQEEMLAIRESWFEEVAGPPPGNKLALERAAWQEPVDSDAISVRAKAAAAEEKVKAMLEAIRLRGCKEEFIPDPAKIAEGKVDFLPTAKLSKEELAKRQSERDAILKASRSSTVVVDGQEEDFSVYFSTSFETNGGHMFDITVSFDSEDTSHRVIVGRDYYKDYGVEPEDVVVLAMGFLLSKNEPRQTEGMLLSSQFPVNYFSISELDQLYDDFAVEFGEKFGELQADKFWRFNRIHDYGAMYEDAESLSVALRNGYDGEEDDDDEVEEEEGDDDPIKDESSEKDEELMETKA